MMGVSETAITPLLKTDGSYNITYNILVQNYGAINLKTIQLVNSLSTTFTSPLTYTIVGLTATGTLAVNAGYNGTTNTNLLNAAASTLTVGSSATVALTVNVAPHGTYGVFNNTTSGTAVTNNADAVAINDGSTNNASPNHADAGKTPLNFDDPTPVALNHQISRLPKR